MKLDIRQELFAAADPKYKAFHKKLIPDVQEDKIIGVRIPQLRKLGKKLENDDFAWDYYEEVMLHGFYIGYKKMEYSERLSLLDGFVPRIDNWAVCDCVCASLKFIEKKRAEFLQYLKKFMDSEKEYELRFAAVILMDYYLTDDYIDFSLNWLKSVNSEYYYVQMAVAWALCTAFTKYQDKVMPVLESKTLPKDVQNRTISKIRDSFRVDRNTKEYLKSLRA